jgi:hypothetical protein
LIAQKIEAIDIGDYFKFKSFCTAKEIINRAKRQPIEWEAFFSSRSSNRGIIFRIKN